MFVLYFGGEIDTGVTFVRGWIAELWPGFA